MRIEIGYKFIFGFILVILTSVILPYLVRATHLVDNEMISNIDRGPFGDTGRFDHRVGFHQKLHQGLQGIDGDNRDHQSG